VLLGGFAAFLSFVFLRSVPKYELVDTNSFYERLEIYKTSILGIRENPFFGGGIDRFNEVYFSLNVSENLKLVDNAHSIPLQLLATTGLCGFIAWLVLFQRAIKTPIHKNSPVPTALYFGVLAYLITGLFGIQVPAIEFLVYLMLGGISALVPRGLYKEFSGKVRTVLTGILVLVLVFSSLQISTYLSQLNKLDNIAYSKAKFDKGKQDFFMGIQEINDIGLLLNAGQLSIRTGDREFSLLVLKQMINLNSFDQRTIAFILQLAGEWDSAELQKIGSDLTVNARDKS
jgi:O-antigen ligase